MHLLHHRFYFIAQASGSVSCDNNILTNVLANILEHSNIAKNRSSWATNVSSKTLRQVVNKLQCCQISLVWRTCWFPLLLGFNILSSIGSCWDEAQCLKQIMFTFLRKATFSGWVFLGLRSGWMTGCTMQLGKKHEQSDDKCGLISLISLVWMNCWRVWRTRGCYRCCDTRTWFPLHTHFFLRFTDEIKLKSVKTVL